MNVVMLHNGVSMLTSRGSMAVNTHANWVSGRNIYGDDDSCLSMEGCEHTYLFHWSPNLEKKPKEKHIIRSLENQHKQLSKEYKDVSNTMWIVIGGCPQVQPQRRVCTTCLNGWGSRIIIIMGRTHAHCTFWFPNDFVFSQCLDYCLILLNSCIFIFDMWWKSQSGAMC